MPSLPNSVKLVVVAIVGCVVSSSVVLPVDVAAVVVVDGKSGMGHPASYQMASYDDESKNGMSDASSSDEDTPTLILKMVSFPALTNSTTGITMVSLVVSHELDTTTRAVLGSSGSPPKKP